MADAAQIKVGDIIAGRYDVRGMIGRGGMGRIYRVFDKVLGEEVALKTLLPDHTGDKVILDRFFNEAKIARSLSHPSIVRVHDIGRAGDTVYISMELLKGKSLRQMLDQLQPGQRLPIAGILRMFDALCAALDYAHRYTVHRDIKPENVMILENGAVKLMDFGISKLMGNPNLTSASIVMGTPTYMAPEQLKNTSTVDRRADVYSVGVMLYEVITGDRPTGMAKPASKLRGEVPAALDPIIEKCCQVDPGKRYQTADELRVALRAVRIAVEKKTDPGASNISTAETRATTRRRRTPVTRIVAAVIVLIAIGGGAYAGLRWAETRRQNLINAAALDAPDMDLPAPAGASSAQEFRKLSNEISRLQRRAETAAMQYSDVQRTALIDPILARGAELWAAATDAASTEPERAVELGWDAAACYLAPTVWPDGMVFVPPAAASAVPRHHGFFIDARPVSSAAFAEFRQSAKWRQIPATSNPSDEPMSGATWFDALAFVASQQPPRRLPTLDDYEYAVGTLDAEQQRVFDLGNEPSLDELVVESDTSENKDEAQDAPPPERTAMPWLLFPGDRENWSEWTATPIGSTTLEDPMFDDRFATWTSAWSSDGVYAAGNPGSARVQDSSEALGFRGILDLPRDASALALFR